MVCCQRSAAHDGRLDLSQTELYSNYVAMTSRKVPTAMKSLTAISLSCLVEGLDEEAVDVENRAENRGEKPRREAMVKQSTWKWKWNDE